MQDESQLVCGSYGGHPSSAAVQYLQTAPQAFDALSQTSLMDLLVHIQSHHVQRVVFVYSAPV